MMCKGWTRWRAEIGAALLLLAGLAQAQAPPPLEDPSAHDLAGAGSPALVRPAVILVTFDGVRWQEIFQGTDREQAARAKLSE
ncbi:MAG: hypothetical protein RMJ98_02655, partial [Myxococcales bacterium]|nr:hypothetical protein [Myxococcales bacterium]